MKNILRVFSLLCPLIAPVLAFGYCPCEEKTGWNFKDDILYWTSHQSGLAFTNKPSNILLTDDFTQTHMVQPSFQWEYGFRLGLGYTLCDKSWTYNVNWIHVESKCNGESHLNSGAPDYEGSFPVWSISNQTLPGDFITDSSMRWHLHTDIVDFNAEYHYNWCDRCFVTPFAGVRLAMLTQKLDAKYEGGTFFNGTDKNKIRENFYGAGPRAGLDIAYYMGCGFSMFAMGAVDALYGYFHNTHHEYYLDVERFDGWEKSHHFVLGTDYSAGVKWQGIVLDSWPEVILGLSWEGHEFYHLNRIETGSYDFFKNNRNLSLYGFTFSGGLSF